MQMQIGEKLAIAAMTRYAIPVAKWGGALMIEAIRYQFVHRAFATQTALTVTAGVGAVVFLVKTEDTLDFVLRQIASVSEGISLLLGAAANQIRSLEKMDLEGFIHKPFDYVWPVYEGPEPAPPSHSQQLVKYWTPTFKTYTLVDFPYFIGTDFLPRYINDEESDKLIRAYNYLGVDVVSMILKDYQLPNLAFIRDLYLHLIRQQHPDKTRTDTNSVASEINQAYGDIKTMMSDVEAQFDFLRAVLQKFNKGAFPSLPYIYLFVGGAVLAILIVR
jgi:hypothetical protein